MGSCPIVVTWFSSSVFGTPPRILAGFNGNMLFHVIAACWLLHHCRVVFHVDAPHMVGDALPRSPTLLRQGNSWGNVSPCPPFWGNSGKLRGGFFLVMKGAPRVPPNFFANRN